MKKLFVLGVDGATFDLLKPWVQNGDLPGFGTLLNNGLHGILKSSIPPLSPVAWTSIATGVNPGKHGIYDFLLEKTNSASSQPFFSFATGGDRKTKAFWEILTDYDKSSVIVNMPCSYPPDPIKGIMISGWDAGKDKANGFYPQSLYQEITEKLGPYYLLPIDILSGREMASRDRKSDRKLHKAVMQMAELRRKVLMYLARKYDWDLFFGVFYESDIVQHRFWKTLEADYAASPIFHVYKEIDFFIQDLLKEFGNDIDILLISDHGFAPLVTGVDLNLYLDQQGFLQRKKSLKGKTVFFLLRHLTFFRRFLKRMSRTRFMPERLSGMKPRHMQIDFNNSLLYFEGTYPYFYVLNDEKKEVLFPDLQRSLLSLEYNGMQVFDKILPKEKVFWGPYIEQIPDFIGIINNHFEVAGADVFMPKKRDKNDCFLDHVWDGNHTESGVLIFKGEESTPRMLDPYTVFDITPTILAHFDIPIPREMDGEPIKEILGAEDFNYSGYNIYKDESIASGLNDNDMQLLEERLRALGYIA